MPDEYARAVSEEVRSLMGKQRMTGIRLSELTGMSSNYLAKRLRDELPFTLNDVHKIAEAMGTSYADLVVPPAIEHDARTRSGRKPRPNRKKAEVS